MTDEEMADLLRQYADHADFNASKEAAIDTAVFVDEKDGPKFREIVERLRPDATIAEFSRLYVGQGNWMDSRYKEIPLPWCPTDLWMLQEYVFAGKPFWLVETDTLWGGMATYLGDLLDRLQRGRVLSTGLRRPPAHSLPEHRRVRWLDRDPRIAVTEARRLMWEEHDPVASMILVHGTEDPGEYGALLRLYGALAAPGSYLVAYGTWRPEIAEVVRAYVDESPFVVDPDGERHGLTLAPGGWLHLPPETL